MTAHERFRIEGGDGDPEFFAEPIVLRPISAPWFPGKIGEWYGDAMLFMAEGGRYEGEHIALTPRTVGRLDAQFATNGWASVIVHRITNPSESFDGSAKDVRSVGMA